MMKKLKYLIGITFAFLLLPFALMAQDVPYSMGGSTGDNVQLVIENTGSGTSRIGFASNGDTTWIEGNGDTLDIQAYKVTINGSPIGGGGADSIYAKYVTIAGDTVSGWISNEDTLLIPVIDYSFNYKQDSYEQEITDGETVEYVGGEGINLYSRSILAGGAQLTVTAAQDNQRVSGSVIWDSLLYFTVTDCQYWIQGNYYTSDATQLQLDAAHATLDRIDVIAVDTNGLAIKITGTPAADPAKPIVDPLSQLELTFVKVDAGATTPGIDTEVVYDENTEWTTSSVATANVTVDFANATSPQVGDSCIKISHDTGGSISGGNATFTDGSTNTLADKTLTFYLKTTGEWNKKSQLSFSLSNGMSRVVGFVMSHRTKMYGFDDTKTTWQRVSVNVGDLPNPGSFDSFDKVSIYALNTWDDGVIIYFDYIELQDIVTPPQPIYNLLTNNDLPRSSFGIPGNDAANIDHAGFYRVVSTTSSMPAAGVTGTMVVTRLTDGSLQYLFMDAADDGLFVSSDGGSNWTEAGGGASELEKITENWTGWRLLGVDPDNYGNIGNNAVDFSIQDQASTTRGATATSAFAEGFRTQASATYTHSEGYETTASGSYGHSEGYRCTAGYLGHAEGWDTDATGNGAHSEGRMTLASGGHAHAEGQQTTASGINSHAGGVSSQATGTGAFARGNQTIAEDDYTFATGQCVKASAPGSFASGWSFTSGAPIRTDGDYSFNHQYQLSDSYGGTATVSATGAAVLGGTGNEVKSTAIHSVILGGYNQTANQPNMVYVPAMKLDTNSVAPPSPEKGTIYYDPDDDHFYGWDGTAWKQLDN